MTRPMLTGTWWADSIERAVRAGAAAMLATFGADQVGILETDWAAAGSIAAMAAVVSFLTSVVAGGSGDHETAGFATRRYGAP